MRIIQYGCDIKDDGQVHIIQTIDEGKESGKPVEYNTIVFPTLEDAERVLSKMRVKVWEALRADRPYPQTPREAMKFLDHAHSYLLNHERRIGIPVGEIFQHPDYDAMDIINTLATQISQED